MKARCKKNGIPFGLDLSDLVVPTHCPVFGLPLVRNGRVMADDNPSVDRIDPALGYVKGNVWVISWRANRLKNNAKLWELEALVGALKKRLRPPRRAPDHQLLLTPHHRHLPRPPCSPPHPDRQAPPQMERQCTGTVAD